MERSSNGEAFPADKPLPRGAVRMPSTAGTRTVMKWRHRKKIRQYGRKDAMVQLKESYQPSA